MNIIPTLEGGLRIEIEDPADWFLLHTIAKDCTRYGKSLAAELSEWIDDPGLQSDWHDFVIPDLEREFSCAIEHVIESVRCAETQAKDGPGTLRITPQDGPLWFSALNQARLAIEDYYHFSRQEPLDMSQLDPIQRAAFLRSRLYCAIQSQLLDHVMR